MKNRQSLDDFIDDAYDDFDEFHDEPSLNKPNICGGLTTWDFDETASVSLPDTETFTAESVYDALGRVKLQTNPDTSVVRPEFHQSGRLNKLHVQLNGDTAETDFVTGIAYNPKGQRESIAYGNGTTTAYGYEKETFRLTSLVTTRTSDAKTLQDIGYVYDPVGNIVKIRDDSHNRVLTGSGPVEPEMAPFCS